MNDSILERLKTLIAACPHLEKAKVYTDFVREDEICCGIFPVGEKRLSADWAGNERWQYDFTIQMARICLSGAGTDGKCSHCGTVQPVDERKRREKWIPAEWERMESLWTGQGHLLYPAQDGQTFVYEMAGRLIYWRKRTDAVPQRHWFFAFESIEERSWLECAEGIVKIEEKGMENTWLFDLSGRKRGTEIAAGEIVFTGWLCPQDPFQNRALRQDAQQAVQWFAAAKRAKRQMPEPREAFAIYKCRGFLRQKMIPLRSGSGCSR